MLLFNKIHEHVHVLSITKSCIAAFLLIISLMFDIIISLHSVILVPYNSFTMLVDILLFQHYSYQICNLLFSILCTHNRLTPSQRFYSYKETSNYQPTTISISSHCNYNVILPLSSSCTGIVY